MRGSIRPGSGSRRPVGDRPETYQLTEADVDELLEAARLAAHESGERINAPLLCFLLGRAGARHPSSTLPELIDAVAHPEDAGRDDEPAPS